MRKSILALIMATVLIGGTAQAAPPGPEGTIAVDDSQSDLVFNGHVTFDVFVDDTNIVDPLAEVDGVTITVACWQDPDAPGGGVVYQNSGLVTSSHLLEQQSGLASLGMIWDADQPASCVGWLRYAFIKGKNHYLRVMDQVEFTVHEELV